MNDGLAAETDLQCAAAWIATNMDNFANTRTYCCRAVVALAKRLQPLSVHLRKRQEGAVAQVATKIHVAFLAVAMILLQWPDVNLPQRYIIGFRSLGMLETTRVLRQIPQIAPVPVRELLADAPSAFAALNSCVSTDEAARFLLAESHKDLSKGFASPLVTRAEADSK